MNIKSKETEIFYATCILCGELSDLLSMVEKFDELSRFLLAHPKFRSVIEIKEKLEDRLKEFNQLTLS